MMANTFRLIDGYNLMHAAGMARERYGPGDLERCRNRFVNWLVGQLSRQEKKTATLVFDAQSTGNSSDQEYIVAGLTILYAAASKDADTLIEELIIEHSAPRQIVVVSSDHRLHKAAKRRKAKATDSEDFIKWLENREVLTEQIEPSPTDKLQAPSETEVEEWMQVFGGIPEAKQLKPDATKPENQSDWIKKIEEEFNI